MPSSPKYGGRRRRYGKYKTKRQKREERQKSKKKTNYIFDLSITASLLPTFVPENMGVKVKDGLYLYFVMAPSHTSL
jgi:hypothetical protein